MRHSLVNQTYKQQIKTELGGKDYDTYDENKQLDSRRVQ
jgi:hypothetical protein